MTLTNRGRPKPTEDEQQQTKKLKKESNDDAISGKRQLELIPPNTEDKDAMFILHRLSELLQREEIRRKFDKRIKDGIDVSIRRIQTDRYELFLSAEGKTSEAFDDIISNDPALRKKDCRRHLILYAERQAIQDSRIVKDFKFGNFSIIITYGQVDAQTPHIDLLEPNFQFGLVLTDNSPGTLVYDTTGNHIKTKYDLVQALKAHCCLFGNSGEKLASMPTKLFSALASGREVETLLNDFGDVLVPTRTMIQQYPNCKTGSLLCLPGSIMHAGPSSQEFRAIMFFSGRPGKKNTKVEEYNPDTQYTDVYLCSQILSQMWRQRDIGTDEREYLIRMLVWYIQRAVKSDKGLTKNPRHYGLHVAEPGVSKFIETIESRYASPTFTSSCSSSSPSPTKIRQKQKRLETIIRNTAKDVEFCGYYMHEFRKISVRNLVLAEKRNEKPRVSVYQRKKDNKIVLYYPTENVYEGTKAYDNFQFRFYEKGVDKADEYHHKNGHRLFDGTNGEILDTDGEKIHFDVLK